VAENPQSESACGCGSSFAVKNFSANPALDWLLLLLLLLLHTTPPSYNGARSLQ
jgi:hypothetical protein